ncbi:aspartate/glutamate racemase family protein [Amycolatopsis pithecellobii]|uniref:Hydantoin racemase n=1 Tax=Amycolatopsis pithecellobii TaxID=664692 RepID=A0A6N7YI55_9PSEU|nr:aspartate/glutamate racemase family protein [Amycolatopsis pithecellobii]MTD52587.1 Asp/Glu/hydantoin racemase [Amycolatopsis pithecellobii]
MRILVVNPNTTEEMTEAIGAAARHYASPGTEIIPLTARFGAAGIDSNFESLLSAVAVMDLVSGYQGPFDAVVLAGFGEHGREGMQEIVDVPVFDIAECSAHVAQLIGRSYSVVTTLHRSIAAIEDRLTVAGLSARCASVRAAGLSTLDIERYPERAAERILEQARLAVHQDRAEVLCLGCAGMTGLDEKITTELGVPVVDGIGAAVGLAEAVVGMGLRTSKVCTYARPEPNQLTGWPITARVERSGRAS